MKNKDMFSGLHPAVNFFYFAIVLVFSMFFMHPVCLLISIGSAYTYSIYLNGKKAVRFNFLYMLPVLLITAIISPLFNHAGVTILAYFYNGNPLTLESIIYGIASAIMMVSVICWFSCYNAVMTSDKFVYLFGRVIPALSLVLSMTLRFIPKYKAEIKTVSNAQRCIGRSVSDGGVMSRAKNGLTILSILTTWSLENAIETADSMRSRGYGLRGRTAFSIYRFEKRDALCLAILLALSLYVLFGYFAGGIHWSYFPAVEGPLTGAYSISVYAAYFALCIFPVIIDIREDKKWKRLQSEI